MTGTSEGKLEGNRGRESRVYSLTSVASAELSTGGTPTSTPPLSPCVSVPLARPPTQGGGPLSSHPTTPIDMPGAWLSTSDLPLQARTSSRAGKTDTSTLNSSHSPTSSATPSFSAATSQRRRSSGVRKLLSLSSLRNSFKGPKNPPSVSSPMPVSEPFNPIISTNLAYGERPPSQATLSTRPQGTKRSASASLPSLVTAEGGQPRLRKRKSTGWFRRKSQIFLFGDDGFAEDNDTQEYVTGPQSIQNPAPAVDDHHHTHLQRPKSSQTTWAPEIPRLYQTNPEPQPDEEMEEDISEPPPPPPLKNPERAKSYGALQTYQVPERPQTYHAPRSYHFPLVLPEVDTLGGGSLNGGSLGAEDMFASIGR